MQIKKKKFVLSSSLRIPDPYLYFKSPQTFLSSLGTPDFLSTCLGIGSLIPPFSFRRIMLPRERGIIFIP